MKTKPCAPILTVTALIAVLAGAGAARAATPAAEPLAGTSVGQDQFEMVDFSDSAEARKLHQAYRILASSDHDYQGHRVKAMQEIETAAGLLGVDLSGDRHYHSPQPWSDDQMREAQKMLRHVRNSAEVKDQDRITRHLDEAINQIDAALATH